MEGNARQCSQVYRHSNRAAGFEPLDYQFGLKVLTNLEWLTHSTRGHTLAEIHGKYIILDFSIAAVTGLCFADSQARMHKIMQKKVSF